VTTAPSSATTGDLPSLPQGWRWTELASLAAAESRAITDGPFGSNLRTSHYTESGPRVIRLQNIGEGQFLDAEAHIDESRFEALKPHEAKAGDIVLASLGESLPRACLVPEWLGPAIVKADCPRFRPGPEHNARFLVLALNSVVVRDQAAQLVHGLGRPRLKLASLKRLMLPVPPRPEQDCIVQRIKATDAYIGEGESSFLRALDGLALYRSASLHSRIGWARWPHVDLGDVANVASGLTKGRRTRDPVKPWNFLRAGNLGNGCLKLDEIKQIDATEKEATQARLQVGDVLMVEGSGSAQRLGQGWVWEGQVADCLHQNHVFRARPDTERLASRFLAWALQAPASRKYFHDTAKTTSGLNTINKAQVCALSLPLPPLEEQLNIVAELDQALDATTTHEATLRSQLAASQLLRRAVLTDAVLGRRRFQAAA